MAASDQLAPTAQGGFLHLDREGRWPGFHRDGLDLDAGGTLRLGALPAALAPLSVAAPAAVDGPSGVAVGPDGSVYYSVPGEARIYRVDACDGSAEPVPCGGAPGSLRQPRGLWWAPRRRALLAADPGSGRVDVLEADSLRLRELWSGAGPFGGAGFDAPWAVAGDGKGGVYVADHGRRSVRKFDLFGQPVPSFWENAAGAVQEPTGVAATTGEAGTRVYVLDAARRAVVALDGEGRPVVDATGAPLTLGGGVLQAPMGLAADGDAVYVGDNQRLRVLVLQPADGALAGEAVGYHGPVAALALDGAGRLLVHAGGGAPPIPLTLGLGRRSRGLLWSEPIQARNLPVHWRRLQLLPGTLPPRAHLQLFVCTGNDPAAGPAAPDPASPAPFADGRWRAGPPDVGDLFVGGKAAGYLWIGAVLSGDGTATPELSQVRVDYDQQSYLPWLPRLYRQHPPGDHFLLRWLSLFESFFGEVEAETSRLPALFDPQAAPAAFLEWLAGWLAIPWDERWDEAQARAVIANAFERSGWRGTALGLRQALKDLAGVDAIVEEPLLHMAWWALPASAAPACACGGAGASTGSCGCGGAGSSTGSCGCGGGGAGAGDAGPLLGAADSVLGFTTMLASAEPQGAVVGMTAVLDQSHLVAGEALGGPLFEDVAHRFSVLVRRGQVPGEAALARVRAVIEAEKPAHTDYQLCVVEASLRVGFQARVGVDTVVAGQGAALRLDEAAPAGRAVQLGGALPGQVGRSRVGESTRMG